MCPFNSVSSQPMFVSKKQVAKFNGLLILTGLQYLVQVFFPILNSKKMITSNLLKFCFLNTTSENHVTKNCMNLTNNEHYIKFTLITLYYSDSRYIATEKSQKPNQLLHPAKY